MRIFFLGKVMEGQAARLHVALDLVQGDIPEIYDECELRLDIPTSQNDRRVVTGHFIEGYVFSGIDTWAEIEIQCDGKKVFGRRFDVIESPLQLRIER